MASFNTKTIDYTENRTDGGYSWAVKYDLKFVNSTIETTLRVKLVGADPGTSETAWKNGANAIWNQRAFFSDGTRLHEVKLNFSFVQSGEHQTVTVQPGAGRYDMLNWYVESDSWGRDKYDELAAHEVGHMLGNYDEYSGGATNNGVTRTATLMSDLTQGGFGNYFWGIEFFAETYARKTFSTVLALRGSNSSTTINGSVGMDGVYGFGGNDRIFGRNGNDFLDGGSGKDTIDAGNGADILIGGAGRDVLYGRSGRDIFDFNARTESVRGSQRDVIQDFSRTQRDRIDLVNIDADTDGTGGNQAFRFIGSRAFSGVDGQLRFSGGVVQGDTDGNRVADFEIRVVVSALAAGDFLL